MKNFKKPSVYENYDYSTSDKADYIIGKIENLENKNDQFLYQELLNSKIRIKKLENIINNHKINMVNSNNKMDEEQAKDLLSRINQEGFHYCFIYYSDFKEINDKKFHSLRKKYIKAFKELEEYVSKISQS
jgi:regulator of replication initiation timing